MSQISVTSAAWQSGNKLYRSSDAINLEVWENWQVGDLIRWVNEPQSYGVIVEIYRATNLRMIMWSWLVIWTFDESRLNPTEVRADAARLYLAKV